MAVDEGLVEWTKEALEPIGTVTFRRMMGGATLYLDGTRVDEASLRSKLQAAHKKSKEVRAVIAADGGVAHRQVVQVIDLLRQEHITRFGINVNPDDLQPTR